MDKPKLKTKGKATKQINIQITRNAKTHTISTTDWGFLTRETCSFFGLKEKSIKFYTHEGKRVDNTFPLEDGLKLVVTEGPFIKPETVVPNTENTNQFVGVPPNGPALLHGAVQILPFLYLGSLYTAREEEYLKTLQVNYVLNAAHDLENFFPQSFTYCNVAIQDKEASNILQYFTESNQFIENARASGAVILVHCRGGVSRSVTLIIAYLLWKYQLPLKKAFHYMKQRKNSVAPNKGFMEQLLKYENLC